MGVTGFPRGDGPRGLVDRLVVAPASSEELPARSAADVRDRAARMQADLPPTRADYEKGLPNPPQLEGVPSVIKFAHRPMQASVKSCKALSPSERLRRHTPNLCK